MSNDTHTHTHTHTHTQINPVSPNWLIFGTSVALYVFMKLPKLFEQIQNGFQDMPY